MPRTKTFGEIIGEDLNADPDFRAEWQRLAPAREFAAAILRFRADNSLSQRQLAERLGVSQPRVVKLESGEHNPDVDTIIHVVRTLDIEFCLDVAPAARKVKLMTKHAQEVGGCVEHGDVRVVAASNTQRRAARAA
jgi:DNA-binding XRE family transcriptional regulator